MSFFCQRIVRLLAPVVLQLRLIQESPLFNRAPWSIEQFQVFHVHRQLKWSSDEENLWNTTFLTINSNDPKLLIYQTRDVEFESTFVVQVELNCSHSNNYQLQYSTNFGLNWLELPSDKQTFLSEINFESNFSRLTFPLNLFSNSTNSIRFRLSICSPCRIQYIFIGPPCPNNCYGAARCHNGHCQFSEAFVPQVKKKTKKMIFSIRKSSFSFQADFREMLDRDFQRTRWLQFDPFEKISNRLFWTTEFRQAITRPIDLRPIK